MKVNRRKRRRKIDRAKIGGNVGRGRQLGLVLVGERTVEVVDGDVRAQHRSPALAGC